MAEEYAIDANILIAVHRSQYPFDIAPGFWRQLVENGRGKLILIEEVRNEIYDNEDELSSWLKENEGAFKVVSSSNEDVVRNYSDIITNVRENTNYKEVAKSEFARVADSWLCAHALTSGYIIVTLEKFEPNIKKRIKIPNVCEEFNIPYINLLEFMKKIGIRFD